MVAVCILEVAASMAISIPGYIYKCLPGHILIDTAYEANVLWYTNGTSIAYRNAMAISMQ